MSADNARPGDPAPAGRGFTLVELALVLALLAIVLAIAIPQYSSVLKKAQASEVNRVFAEQRRELEIYRQEHDSYGDGLPGSDRCGVAMPEGRFFRFDCRSGPAAGPEAGPGGTPDAAPAASARPGYTITAVALSGAAVPAETERTAARYAIDQDGRRYVPTVELGGRQLGLACVPIAGLIC